MPGIIVGVDGSDHSRYALGWAAGPLPELPAADEEWGRRLRDERLAAVSGS